MYIHIFDPGTFDKEGTVYRSAWNSGLELRVKYIKIILEGKATCHHHRKSLKEFNK